MYARASLYLENGDENALGKKCKNAHLYLFLRLPLQTFQLSVLVFLENSAATPSAAPIMAAHTRQYAVGASSENSRGVMNRVGSGSWRWAL